jgi:hypothetical protein
LSRNHRHVPIDLSLWLIGLSIFLNVDWEGKWWKTSIWNNVQYFLFYCLLILGELCFCKSINRLYELHWDERRNIYLQLLGSFYNLVSIDDMKEIQLLPLLRTLEGVCFKVVPRHLNHRRRRGRRRVTPPPCTSLSFYDNDD